jgi:hypothetical protein
VNTYWLEAFTDAASHEARALHALETVAVERDQLQKASEGFVKILTKMAEILPPRSLLLGHDGKVNPVGSDDLVERFTAIVVERDQLLLQRAAVLDYIDECDNGMGSIQGTEIREILGEAQR